MKKNLLSVIALLAAICALIFSCITVGQLNARIGELERSNDALSAEVRQMSARMDEFFIEPTVTGVEDWTIAPTAWADGSGADVLFSMTPIEFDENVTVRFVVRMDQQPMADVICDWNGDAYSATVGLPAMNGYTYSCVFESASGTDTQILASPDAPTVWDAVYLEDALSYYCDLWVDSWSWENSTLTVSGNFIQVQLAQLGTGASESNPENTAEPEAALVLKRNDTVLSRTGVELVPGEGGGSYEAELADVVFDDPALAELTADDTLQLWLEVRMGTETASACGAEWYLENGELLLVAG